MGDHTVGNSLDITGDGTEDGAVARKPTADTVRQLDLPATRVRLATVAARYSWNRVLARPK